MGHFGRREPCNRAVQVIRNIYVSGPYFPQPNSVKFTLRAIPQVGWTKLKAEPSVKFKAQTLNED